MGKLILKQPTEKLRQKLDDIVKHVRNCATLVDEVIALGKEEGFSEKEIGRMIREKLKQFGYDSRSIRRVLPSSIKDLSKIRKDYRRRSDNNCNDKMDEDILSSSENSNDFDENHKFTSSETVEELQANISTLKDQLVQKQMEIEDLSIQCKNATQILTELRGQLQAMHEGVRTLTLPRDKFPPNCDQVFKLQNHVFLVEFKGTKVLDISVITLEQAYNQHKN
jgi:hypothetical protein